MNVLVDKNKLDILANAISAKSEEPVTMTLDEMVEAVDGIDTSGITPTGNIDITEAGTTDVTNYATATVAELDDMLVEFSNWFETQSGQRKWVIRPQATNSDSTGGFVIPYMTYRGDEYPFNAVPSNTTVTPTESSQTIGGTKYMMEGGVTVNAIPSNYVGSGITQRSSSDLTASGATVTVPSGYYSAQASKSVSNGTAGTPTATKGAVSNHSVSITPSVTNVGGYITGGTKTGTAVTVSASELVSGSDTVTQNDTYDVTNLAELVVDVPSGGGSVTVTDEANATGITCVITSGGTPPTPSDIPLNTQLIKYGDVVSGYIIDSSTGDEMVSQWSCCSDYTLIDPSMTFNYIGYQWYYLAFYDDSKSFISSIYMATDKDSVENDYAHGTLSPAKIPSTAKYVRISSYPTNPSSTQLSLIRTA